MKPGSLGSRTAVLITAAFIVVAGCGSDSDSGENATPAAGCTDDESCPAGATCMDDGECRLLSDPCAGIACGPNGSCSAMNGQPTCGCDEGYHAVGSSCFAASGSATLFWSAPTTYEDGSPLSGADLGGYVIRYGSAAGVYPAVEDIGLPTCDSSAGAPRCRHVVTSLEPGNWYFTVSAYDTRGNESELSRERSKLIP